jgi:hypothetical protein
MTALLGDHHFDLVKGDHYEEEEEDSDVSHVQLNFAFLVFKYYQLLAWSVLIFTSN